MQFPDLFTTNMLLDFPRWSSNTRYNEHQLQNPIITLPMQQTAQKIRTSECERSIATCNFLISSQQTCYSTFTDEVVVLATMNTNCKTQQSHSRCNRPHKNIRTFRFPPNPTTRTKATSPPDPDTRYGDRQSCYQRRC